METPSDLVILLSDLTRLTDGVADMPAHRAHTHVQMGAVLQTLIADRVSAHCEGMSIEMVSASLDVASPFNPGMTTRFVPEVARKTRTLVFAHGLASQAGRADIARDYGLQT